MQKIRKIEFFNREGETKEIMNILKSEPQLINFIYGPINSGKTSLIMNLIESLSDDYIVFYIDLRGKFISDYEDFIRALFRIEKDKETKEILKDLAIKAEKTIYFAKGVPINESVLESLFKSKTREDIFEFMEDYFKEIARTKIPILIIDELQVIGDLEIDGLIIYKLFNFFIRLTKVLHLCHVFALSSDSLFIEKVHSEALLQERCEYLLVDEFDEQTTRKFLNKYGFNEDEQDLAWQYFGGKPIFLSNLILSKTEIEGTKDIKRRIDEKIKNKIGHLRDMLDELLYVKPKIPIRGIEKEVEREKVIGILNKFADASEIKDMGLSRPEKNYLIKENLLFIDPRKGIIKPQSKLDLIAIREILKEVNMSQ